MELDELIQSLTEIRDRNKCGDATMFIALQMRDGYFGGDITDVFVNASGGVTIQAFNTTD